MNVKGTAYITRKDSITNEFGEKRWKSFHTKLEAKDKYFSQIIMNITMIPVDKFILFLEEMLKEFYHNDNTQYWNLGEKAAEFTLSPGGAYHSYLLTKDIKQFVESGMPKLWSTYFNKGTLTAKLENNVVHITIAGLPINHIYFEYLIMGYHRQALVIFGKKVFEHRVRGFSLGNNDIYYTFEIS